MFVSHRVSTPTKDKLAPEMKDFSMLENFFGKNYNPTQVKSWNYFLISDKQSECGFSDSTDMTVQQYIDVVLSQYKDFSLRTLNNLSDKETRLLTDMLLRMDLSKLQVQFGDYILYYLIFESYPYGRYESYLKPYCEENLKTVVTYGWEKFDMLVNATWRLRMQKMTFIDYIQLLRLFITLRGGIHNDMYNEILKKYTIKNIDIADITIESLSPRTSMPHGYTKYGDIWEDDIQKNEQRAKDCFLDAPLTLCLCYKGEQIALIAGMLWHYDTFVIHQMQTISSHVFTSNGITKPKITHPLVQVLDWQNILFECMKYTVDSLGVKKTYIQPGEMNHRTKEMYTIEIYNRKNNQIVSSTTTDIPHLSKEIAHKIYDVFAEERGFTKDATGFWKEKKYLRKNNTTSKRLSNTA